MSRVCIEVNIGLDGQERLANHALYPGLWIQMEFMSLPKPFELQQKSKRELKGAISQDTLSWCAAVSVFALFFFAHFK